MPVCEHVCASMYVYAHVFMITKHNYKVYMSMDILHYVPSNNHVRLQWAPGRTCTPSTKAIHHIRPF